MKPAVGVLYGHLIFKIIWQSDWDVRLTWWLSRSQEKSYKFQTLICEGQGMRLRLSLLPRDYSACDLRLSYRVCIWLPRSDHIGYILIHKAQMQYMIKRRVWNYDWLNHVWIHVYNDYRACCYTDLPWISKGNIYGMKGGPIILPGLYIAIAFCK